MNPGRMGELATQPSVTAESFGMSEGCAIREDGREPSAIWASEAAARTARHDVLGRSGPHTVEDSCSGEACSLSRTLANTQSEEQGAQQQQHSGRKRDASEAGSPGTVGGGWSEPEHRAFLTGLGKLGKGDWRGISRIYVPTRTPTQVASHAQKHFIRQSNSQNRKRRISLFDIVPERQTPSPPTDRHQIQHSPYSQPEPGPDPRQTEDTPSITLPATAPSASHPGVDMLAMLQAQSQVMQIASYAALYGGQGFPGALHFAPLPPSYVLPAQGSPAYMQMAMAQQQVIFMQQQAMVAANLQYGVPQVSHMLPGYPHHLLPPGQYMYPDGQIHYSSPLPSHSPTLRQHGPYAPQASLGQALKPNAGGAPEAARWPSARAEACTAAASQNAEPADAPRSLRTLFRPKAFLAVRQGCGTKGASSPGASGQTGGSGQSSQSALQLLEAIRRT